MTSLLNEFISMEDRAVFYTLSGLEGFRFVHVHSQGRYTLPIPENIPPSVDTAVEAALLHGGDFWDGAVISFGMDLGMRLVGYALIKAGETHHISSFSRGGRWLLDHDLTRLLCAGVVASGAVVTYEFMTSSVHEAVRDIPAGILGAGCYFAYALLRRRTKKELPQTYQQQTPA